MDHSKPIALAVAVTEGSGRKTLTPFSDATDEWKRKEVRPIGDLYRLQQSSGWVALYSVARGKAQPLSHLFNKNVRIWLSRLA